MPVKILYGDCLQVLKSLPSDSVDCVVTSPPYWGLRSYLPDDHPNKQYEIGLEPTLGEHLEVMVTIFREVRRVLKPEGTCWLNYGDCYATSPNGRSAADTKTAGNDDRTFRDKPFSTIGGVFKAKDLCMVPNRLAIALQEDGWWVRSEIIWNKPNPMPESVIDRPGTSHEKIFLLTKSARYFYDAESVKTAMKEASVLRLNQDIENQMGSARANGGTKTNGNMKAVQKKFPSGWQSGPGGHSVIEHNKGKKGEKQRGHSRRHAGFNERWDEMSRSEQQENGANLRNVWTIPTKGFSEAHFATFPPEIPEICIKAGCPDGGLVLDPFGGSGTTGMVAQRMGREAILIELHPDYVEMAAKRVNDDMPMFAEVSTQDVPMGQNTEDCP